MGFFDKFEKWLDESSNTKRVYREDELEEYFKAEMFGVEDSDIGKKTITTNIHEILRGSVKDKYPDMNTWNINLGSYHIEKYDENVYKIEYKGLIDCIKDVYGEGFLYLHYEIKVYTNKYAELVAGEGYKTTIKVW